MIERPHLDKKTVLRAVVAVLVSALVARVALALIVSTSTIIWLPGGALLLGCVLAWFLVQRSRAAHDRAIADIYPSFAPALARRRAEGNAEI
jgi:hypothetical protein